MSPPKEACRGGSCGMLQLRAFHAEIPRCCRRCHPDSLSRHLVLILAPRQTASSSQVLSPIAVVNSALCRRCLVVVPATTVAESRFLTLCHRVALDPSDCELIIRQIVTCLLCRLVRWGHDSFNTAGQRLRAEVCGSKELLASR